MVRVATIILSSARLPRRKPKAHRKNLKTENADQGAPKCPPNNARGCAASVSRKAKRNTVDPPGRREEKDLHASPQTTGPAHCYGRTHSRPAEIKIMYTVFFEVSFFVVKLIL